MRWLKLLYAMCLGYWMAWRIGARAISTREAVWEATKRDLSKSQLN